MAHQELAQQIARYAERDGIFDTPIARLALVRSGQRGEPVHMVQRPALCIIAQGGKRILLGDAVIDYGPASYLVASLDLPITGAVTSGEHGRALSLLLPLSRPCPTFGDRADLAALAGGRG